MAEKYSRSLLRIAVAQICQNLGWHSAQSTPIELLTDVLERYLLNLGRTVHAYSEQFCRTEANLNDVGLAFHNMGISLAELVDYVEHVEPVPLAVDVPRFPVPRPSQLQFPHKNSRELREREEHVDEHLPPMHPDREEELTPERQTLLNTSREMQISPLLGTSNNEKRPMSSPVELTPPPAKRPRILPEEAAHSQYEMRGVMMSTTGFLTPTRGQGKLPDARTPPPPTPATPSAVINLNPLIAAAPESPTLETKLTVLTDTVQEKPDIDDPDYKPGDDSLYSPTGVRTPARRESGGRGRGRGKGKGRGRGRSPKQGQSPRAKSPKGPKAVKQVFSDPVAPEPMKVEAEASPESPKLMIDEEEAIQREAAEAREMRMQAYDSTIDDVIKRVMEQQDEEDDVRPATPITYTPIKQEIPLISPPPPPPIIENEEERERRRQLEVQQELENIQVKKKEWERQERQRIERESHIDDTINDVIRNAGVSSDDDNHDIFPDSLTQQHISQLTAPPPAHVFDFEEEDFTPPPIPDIPMSPQQDEPPEDIVIKVKNKVGRKKKGRPPKSPGKSPGRPPKSPGRPPKSPGRPPKSPGSQKVREKLKTKLQKQKPEEAALLPVWSSGVKEEPAEPVATLPPVEAVSVAPISISIPELAKKAAAMEEMPQIQPLKIKALKEEKEHSSKKEKKKKKNKDKDKERDKDKSKEKKKDKKDKEKKKDKHDKEKKQEEEGMPSIPKLTFRFGKDSEVSVDKHDKSEMPTDLSYPKVVLRKLPDPPMPRVPTKAAMKQGPMISPPAPPVVLRPPTPSPPSSPSLPPSPVHQSRVATPPPPSKFNPTSSKPREVTPPPPPSSSQRSRPGTTPKSNPTPGLTVETVGADTPARMDENGEKVWICPSCKMQDDGSPMVGCDKCDDWYHYPCVGITEDPPADQPWYCPRCNARRIKEASMSGSKRGKRGRKKKSVV